MFFKKIHVIFFTFLIMIAGNGHTNPSNQSHKWVRLNGTWEIKNSQLSETRSWTSPWRFYALLDYNTVRSMTSLQSVTEIQTELQLSNPYSKADTTEVLLSFAIRSPYKFWYYHLYGFLLSGDQKQITKISIIHSDRIDATKPYNAKNNYFIKTLVEKSYKLEYGKKYHISIRLHKNTSVLYINQQKILALDLPVKNLDGPIAFSSKFLTPSFNYVKVLSHKKVLLYDGFDKPETLWIPGVKVKIESKEKVKK